MQRVLRGESSAPGGGHHQPQLIQMSSLEDEYNPTNGCEGDDVISVECGGDDCDNIAC